MELMLITDPEPCAAHRLGDSLREREDRLEVDAEDGAEGVERRLPLRPARRRCRRC